MSQISVNTRPVGEPQGACLLYLEDYVHTFIRKIEQEDRQQGTQREISLWGYEFEEDGRRFFVVSGALDLSLPAVSGERFFPSCCCIGQAVIKEGIDMQLGLEVTLPNHKKLLFNDFYIYYAQNEEMQNYLIEWNLNHNRGRMRSQPDEAVRFSRIAQNYGREEARVSYLWNTMNLLSLGLMVCIAVFAVISVNSYHKMQEMESKLTYILSLPQETLNILAEASKAESLTAEHDTEETQVFYEESSEVTESITETGISAPQTEENTLPQTEEAAQTPQTEPATEAQPAAAALQQSLSQYYVVQQGDTLRSISYRLYGTYTRVEDICLWNGIENPDSILYGQKLLLYSE